MKKKILSLLFVLTICLSMAMPVYAESDDAPMGIMPVAEPGSDLTDDAAPINIPNSDNSIQTGPGPALLDERMSRMVDEADVLSYEDEAALLARLDALSERQEFDVVIITVMSLGGKDALDFADDYFLEYGHGFGENKDGILFMVSPEERDWAFAVSGFGREAFKSAVQEDIVDMMLPYLSRDNYYEAFSVFIDQSDIFINKARGLKQPDFLDIIIPIVLGLLVAFLIVTGMKAQLKSVRSQSKADDYERQGSMNITGQRDIFLYSNVARVARQKSSSSSGSSGSSSGGSSGKY